VRRALPELLKLDRYERFAMPAAIGPVQGYSQKQ
jgi:hypothetical protein